MKTFIVEYLLPKASIWSVTMVQAGNKEQAQSIVKQTTGCVTSRAKPA